MGWGGSERASPSFIEREKMKKSIEDYLNFGTIVLIIMIALLLPACATTESNVKTYPNQQLPTSTRQPVKEVREISHFITFKTPPGAEVIIVDTFTGKEVMSLGTTPVRVLVLTKKLVFIDGRVDGFSDVKPISNALQYGNGFGNGIMGGVEFQFKFRKFGFCNQMLIERIPYLMGDSDKVIEIVMKREEVQ